MPGNPKPQPDDPEQSKRFEETAKELEAEKNKEAFERALEEVFRPQKTQENKRG